VALFSWPSSYGERTLPPRTPTYTYCSVVTHRLIVRITDAFDHQIRRPSLLASPTSKFSVVTNASAESFSYDEMQPGKSHSDGEEGRGNLVAAYMHMLDESRVRHRKLRRFARYVYRLDFTATLF
jgi:hypothetical protein